MLDAKIKLESKLVTIRQEREHLKSLLELVEAKELTTRTIKSLDDLAGVGDEDVQRLGDQIRARLDREEARLEMATGTIRDQIDEAIGMTEIEMQLEERRQRLGLSTPEAPARSDESSTSTSGTAGL
jgi:phage shock protein A